MSELVNAGFRVLASQGVKIVKKLLSKAGAESLAKSRAASGVVTTGIGYALPLVTDSATAQVVASELRVVGLTEAGNDLVGKVLKTEEK